MLDPSRYALNAATVGFRKRMGLAVDWDSFNNAIQNQTDAIKVRRELEETAVTELHVMGGERFGIAGNEKTNTAARQARQMNGYPLRSFLATGGAIVVPPKHGEGLMATPMNVGLTQYTQYNGVVGNYVSSFTEPLNAPLENQSILLGRAGIKARSESASDPYKAMQFMLNMHQSQEQINTNALAHENLRGYNQQGSMADQMKAMQAPMEKSYRKRLFEEKYAENVKKRTALGVPRNEIAPRTPPSVFKFANRPSGKPPLTAPPSAKSGKKSESSSQAFAGRPSGGPPLTAPKAKEQATIGSGSLHSSLTSSVNSTPRETTRDEAGIHEVINNEPLLSPFEEAVDHNAILEEATFKHYQDLVDTLPDSDNVAFQSAFDTEIEALGFGDEEPPLALINGILEKLHTQYSNVSAQNMERRRVNEITRQQNLHSTSFSNDNDPNVVYELDHQALSLSNSMASYGPALKMSRQETAMDKRRNPQTDLQQNYSYRATPTGSFSQQDSSASPNGVMFNLSASPVSRPFQQGNSAEKTPDLNKVASPNFVSNSFSSVKNLFGGGQAKISPSLNEKSRYISKFSITSPAGNSVRQTNGV